MPVGRPPLPTKLHILHGNPGRRPLNTDEPEPEVKIPNPPERFSGIALEEWHRVTKELFVLGLICELDRVAIEIHCEAYARYRKAQDEIAKHAEVVIIKSDNHPNGYPIQNPWYSVLNKEVDKCLRIMTEFGMSAGARSRIHVEPKKKKERDPAAKYFG